MRDPQDRLDDPRLDVVADPRAGVRVKTHGQVRTERLGDRRESRDARFSLAGFDLPQKCVADSGGVGQVAQAQSAVRAVRANLLAELTPDLRRAASG
jgi:hypothetical protein